MFHSLKAERIFNLGEYKNIKVTAETTDIPDEVWESSEQMENIRKDLSLEIFMNFALNQEIATNNNEMFRNREWSLMYERFRTDRHQENYEPILENTDTAVEFNPNPELLLIDEI